MTTDRDAFIQYFHVLIFYEEINEAEISANDFDNIAEMLRKQHLNKQVQEKKSLSRQRTNLREGSTGLISSTGEGALLQHNRFRAKQQFMNQRKATCRVLCAKDLKESKVQNDGSPLTPRKLTLDIVMKESKQRAEERKKHELETKEKMDRMLLNIQSHAGHQGVNDLAQSLN